MYKIYFVTETGKKLTREAIKLSLEKLFSNNIPPSILKIEGGKLNNKETLKKELNKSNLKRTAIIIFSHDKNGSVINFITGKDNLNNLINRLSNNNDESSWKVIMDFLKFK